MEYDSAGRQKSGIAGWTKTDKLAIAIQCCRVLSGDCGSFPLEPCRGTGADRAVFPTAHIFAPCFVFKEPRVFTPDQLVVYPAQGVGKVDAIEHRDIGGIGADFYIVSILGNNITLMVPVVTADKVGLRPLCDPREAQNVLESFKDRSGFSGHIGQNWNRRFREYSERLKSGKLADVSHVVKELLLISGEKELSFGERRLLEQSMGLIVMELSCVLGREPEDLQKEIESYFADILQKEEKEK